MRIRSADDAELQLLRSRWRQWVAIIELVVRRRRGRQHVDRQAYRELHRALLAACREHGDASRGPIRANYRGLEELARPWLTPDTLAKADRVILFDLLLRCRQAEHGLCGRSWSKVALRSVPPAVLIAAVAALLLMSWKWGVSLTIALDLTRSWSEIAWYTLKNPGEIPRLFVVSLVVASVSVDLVARAARE